MRCLIIWQLQQVHNFVVIKELNIENCSLLHSLSHSQLVPLVIIHIVRYKIEWNNIIECKYNKENTNL